MAYFFSKIPVTIQPSFWFLCFFIAVSSSYSIFEILIWILVVFSSVLVHEYGHALSALFWGQQAEIQLSLMGGLTLRSGKPLSLFKEFCVVALGPLFGLGFCLLSACAYNISLYPESFWKPFLVQLYYVNLVWTILNLLPIHPLDGGKLLAILFEALLGYRGKVITFVLGAVCAFSICLFCFSSHSFLSGSIALWLAYENYKSWILVRALKQVKNTPLDALYKAEDEWVKGQQIEAINRLEKALKESGQECAEDICLKLARYYLLRNEQSSAFNCLDKWKGNLTDMSLPLYQWLCYQRGLFHDALKWGTKMYREYLDVDCAVINAFCAAQLKQTELALNWLMCAKQSSHIDMSSVLRSKELDPIRLEADFQKFDSLHNIF